MKFDLILTNPPFQDTLKRGKTPHKLWIDFTKSVFDQLLAEGGVLCQISPTSFRSPSNDILDLMKLHHTTRLRFDTGQHFPAVGSTFADYVIYKQPNGTIPTEVHTNGQRFELVLDEDVFYLPNDLSLHSLSVHRKVIFTSAPKLQSNVTM